MATSPARARLLLWCAAVPCLGAVAVSAGIVLLGMTGAASSFWQGGPLTLSEAAALRDQGAVVQLIAGGSDPNATYGLRPDVLAVHSLTPLEAAVGARRGEMIDLLMMHGAKIDAASWRRLHCFALESKDEDVMRALDQYRPANSDPSCTGVATPF